MHTALSNKHCNDLLLYTFLEQIMLFSFALAVCLGLPTCCAVLEIFAHSLAHFETVWKNDGKERDKLGMIVRGRDCKIRSKVNMLNIKMHKLTKHEVGSEVCGINGCAYRTTVKATMRNHKAIHEKQIQSQNAK